MSFRACLPGGCRKTGGMGNSDRGILLPLFPQMVDAMQEEVIAALRSALIAPGRLA